MMAMADESVGRGIALLHPRFRLDIVLCWTHCTRRLIFRGVRLSVGDYDGRQNTDGL